MPKITDCDLVALAGGKQVEKVAKIRYDCCHKDIVAERIKQIIEKNHALIVSDIRKIKYSNNNDYGKYIFFLKPALETPAEEMEE
ncbi:hypothetical protein KAJ41_02255 [Candidatus Parcubacteria bacterium]|nr:hypothetical protein [Candidatus Parcubacteria bacterium]